MGDPGILHFAGRADALPCSFRCGTYVGGKNTNTGMRINTQPVGEQNEATGMCGACEQNTGSGGDISSVCVKGRLPSWGKVVDEERGARKVVHVVGVELERQARKASLVGVQAKKV